MKKTFSLLVGLLVLGFSFSTMRLEAAEKKLVARVVSVNGQATAGKRGLKPGDTVDAGETISTDANSEVKLLFPDRSVVDLGPATSFKLLPSPAAESEETVSAEVEWGTVRSSIRKKLDKKGKFFLKTKSSVLAVRGTEFIVNIARTEKTFKEEVVVSEGKVEVRSQNGKGEAPVLLVPGKQFGREYEFKGANLVATGAAKISDLNAQQLANRFSQNTIVDHTYVGATEISSDRKSPNNPDGRGPASQGPGTPAGNAGAAIGALGQALTLPNVGFKGGDSGLSDAIHPVVPPPPPINPVDKLPPTFQQGAGVKVTVTFNP